MTRLCDEDLRIVLRLPIKTRDICPFFLQSTDGSRLLRNAYQTVKWPADESAYLFASSIEVNNAWRYRLHPLTNMPSLQLIKYDTFLHTLTAGTEKANKYILTRTEGGTSTTTSDAIIYRVARFHTTYVGNSVSSPNEASCFCSCLQCL